MREGIVGGLERFDADPEVRCIVLAGSEKIFASGADIRAMAAHAPGEPSDARGAEFWRRIAAVETPIVAAVAGYALGGGCELALACDMVVADETVRFGQPEITLRSEETRLNSSHVEISYAVFCLKKKKKNII